MRTILTLAQKDLRLLWRDRLRLFFVIVYPIIMAMAFGLIASTFKPVPGVTRAMKIAVIDKDESILSRRFTESLREGGGVTIAPLRREQATDLVRKGKLLGFVTIPKGFGRTAGILWAPAPALEVGVDPSRLAESAMLQGYIMQAMGRLVQYRFTHPAGLQRNIQESIARIDQDQQLPASKRVVLKGLLRTVESLLGSVGSLMESADSDGTVTMPTMELARIQTVDVVRRKSKQDQLLGKLRSNWDISFPAAIMWGVMACVAGFAASLAKERADGTFLRLQVAPIGRFTILAGKAAACFLACIGVMVMMMLLGWFVGIQLASPLLLALAIVCVAIGFVGLMMLMSLLGKTEQSVNGAAWAIIVTLCMFGGGMLPLAFMPPFMKTLSHFSPVKWAILALEGAVWRGFSPGEMLFPCGVLVGVGVAGFLTGTMILTKQDG